MKAFFVTLFAIIITIGIIFALQYGSIANYKFFAPKIKEAQREVFENSASYIQGKNQELSKYMYEYKLSTDENEKIAIKQVILHSASTVDINDLNPEVRYFIQSLR